MATFGMWLLDWYWWLGLMVVWVSAMVMAWSWLAMAKMDDRDHGRP